MQITRKVARLVSDVGLILNGLDGYLPFKSSSVVCTSVAAPDPNPPSHSSHGDPSSPDRGGRRRRTQAEGSAAPTGEDPPNCICRSGGADHPLPPLLLPRRIAIGCLEIRSQQRRQVPLLGRPRRLPRQALRLLRRARAPGVQPPLRSRGGPLPRQVIATLPCLCIEDSSFEVAKVSSR